MTVIAASAKPAAITKGMATDALAKYLRTSEVTADLALVRRRWNIRSSGLPNGAENKTDCRGSGQRRHRLVPHRLVQRAFEVTGYLLHAFTRLAPLFGDTACHVLSLVRQLAELIRSFVFEIGRRVGRPTICALRHGVLQMRMCSEQRRR